jgi:hypothetical protein
LPGEVAEATGASQLSDTRVWLVGEPPLFGGGGTAVSRWLSTMQFDRANRSPTVVDTTGVYPAALNAELASLYFWPTTLGEDFALAIPAPAMPNTATTAATAAADEACLVIPAPGWVKPQ